MIAVVLVFTLSTVKLIAGNKQYVCPNVKNKLDCWKCCSEKNYVIFTWTDNSKCTCAFKKIKKNMSIKDERPVH